MMIQLFDLQGGKPVPSASTHFIPELDAIRKNFPGNYLDVYAYVFFTTCPDGSNPYANVEEGRREEAIIANLKPKFYLEDLSIIAAQNKCRELYETPSLRAYRGAKRALDRVAQYLEETEITDGKDGSAMTIDRYMSKLSEYRKAYKDAEEDLKEEQAKVRGNLRLRYDQKPGYTNSKEESDE